MRIKSLLVAAVVALCPLAASAQTRYATTSLRLRGEPSMTAAVIGTIPRGAAVQVNGCEYAGGTWCAVEYSAQAGYAAARLLSSSASDVTRVTSEERSTRPRRARSSSVRGTTRQTHLSSATRRSMRSRSSSGGRRSSASSRGYYTGPRGGCYTYSASGRKRYVDRSYCH